MLHTLIVGLGRSGRGLHVPSLAKARAAAPFLFAPGPLLGLDPAHDRVDGVRTVGSLEEAARLRPPAQTVVHLCTPPRMRLEMLRDLADLGYRRVIVEKPLALDLVELAGIARLRRARDLELNVATPWSASSLTRRLTVVRRSGVFGALRALTVVQNKPRFTRSLESTSHPTALDIEVPHALAVAVSLAGDADVVSADLSDMCVEGVRMPGLGAARVDLLHQSGTMTRIESDLTCPTRERRIVLEFDTAVLTGHYPCSEADHTAQLAVAVEGRAPARSVFADDALPAFLRSCYGRYARSWPGGGDLTAQIEAVRLLAEVRNLCAPGTGAREVDSAVGA
ncbi:oxidoreductase [Nocardiopsis sp. NPDC007018]|uniref:oxidoreductase n=1 Tax=Nocardiopsis sp. NPDC007018 TaxID=3155721 RepID=UPI0033DB5A33